MEEHLGLARALARRFIHRGESQDDLVSVANLALVTAADRFDPEFGVPFVAYATKSIVGELKRYFRDKTWAVRPPRRYQELYLAAREAKRELEQEFGRTVTVPEVAARLGASEEDVLQALEIGATYRADSLDRPCTDEDEARDVPVIDAGFEQAVERDQVRQRALCLDDEDRLMLKRLFFDEWTQQQVANELGLSQMQISRRLARTTAKLRR